MLTEQTRMQEKASTIKKTNQNFCHQEINVRQELKLVNSDLKI